MAKRLGEECTNEMQLYHKTVQDKVDMICEENFDFCRAGTGVRALYGQGAYFALEARYLDVYDVADQNKHKFMFVAKVLVGRTCIGNPDFKKPPYLDTNDIKKGTYDTCVNNIYHPTVFCIFDRNQYYPEYIIEYKTDIGADVLNLMVDNGANVYSTNMKGETALNHVKDLVLKESAVTMQKRASSPEKRIFPVHWAPREMLNAALQVALDPNDKQPAIRDEYAMVARMFTTSMPNAEIESIKRVQNGFLWECYVLTKHSMAKRLGEECTNEMQLYHKTVQDKVDMICEENFDFCRAGTGVRALYGQGAYFALEARYLDVYDVADQNKHKFMFVAKVFVGRTCIGNPDFKKPPYLDTNDIKKGTYDTCVNNIYHPTVFCIFDRNQYYPEYIIEYKTDIGADVLNLMGDNGANVYRTNMKGETALNHVKDLVLKESAVTIHKLTSSPKRRILPVHWAPKEMMNAAFQVALDPNDKQPAIRDEYAMVARKFTASMPNAEIESIRRVQNGFLWECYALTKHSMAKRLGEECTNEMQLYHKTVQDKVDMICEENFDFCRAGTGVRALYGQGAYFALEARYLDVYDVADQNKHKFMFVAKVFVGRTCIGNPDFKKPPYLDTNDIKKGTYDTCVNNIYHPTVFCIFDRNQYYPEYIIEYKTDIGADVLNLMGDNGANVYRTNMKGETALNHVKDLVLKESAVTIHKLTSSPKRRILPVHWAPKEMMNAAFQVALDPNDKQPAIRDEYAMVARKFTASMPNAEIESIRRVQNGFLWECYALTKHSMAKRLGEECTNEMQLYHKTVQDKVDMICEENFDFCRAGTGVRALYGQGAYFALEARYLDVYDVADQNKHKFMFVAKVFVGRTCIGNPDFKKPPYLDTNDIKKGTYDTCVNNIYHPTVFCIFDRNQYYPEYIIEYKTDIGADVLNLMGDNGANVYRTNMKGETALNHVKDLVLKESAVTIHKLTSSPKRRILPVHWAPKEMMNAAFQVALDPNDKQPAIRDEYAMVARKFTASMPNAEIESIRRVQNGFLWECYALTKHSMAKRLGEECTNEMQLYHKTVQDKVDMICEENFDFCRAGTGVRALYGQGAYFALEARYLDVYDVADQNKHKFMFVAKVFVGRTCIGNPDFKKPPYLDTNDIKKGTYDTCVNNIYHPTVFCIFDRNQYYPEYIIEYKTDIGADVLNLMGDNGANVYRTNMKGETALNHVKDLVLKESAVTIHKLTSSPKRRILPVHWAPKEMMNAAFQVALDPNDKQPAIRDEYAMVARKFTASMPNAEIESIRRVQNGFLWECYALTKHSMAKRLGEECTNEMQLYHKTVQDKVDMICEENFDFCRAGTGVRALYGQGAYFALEARYLDVYDVADQNKHKFMFVAKVLVGRTCIGNPDFRKPPYLDTNDIKKGTYDTCVNNIYHPTVFCIFDRNQYYPEYIIEYKTDIGADVLNLMGDNGANVYRTNMKGETALNHVKDLVLKESAVTIHKLTSSPKRRILPVHWAPKEMMNAAFQVALDPNDKQPAIRDEYAMVARKFTASMPNAEIESIRRVQNGFLWECYALTKQSMAKRIGEEYTNEMQLYHKTVQDKVDMICEENFDFCRAVTGVRDLYGQGAYFALEARYLDLYDVTDQNKHKFMFVAKVLVGRTCIGNPDFRKPPYLDTNDIKKGTYDTCVNNIYHPTVFCIFYRNQYYPEYIIEYKTDTGVMNLMVDNGTDVYKTNKKGETTWNLDKGPVLKESVVRSHKLESSPTKTEKGTLLPVNWAPKEMMNDAYQVTLDPDDKEPATRDEYAMVKRHFITSMPNAEIKSIKRVQNGFLWECYALDAGRKPSNAQHKQIAERLVEGVYLVNHSSKRTKQMMVKKMGVGGTNEMHLYHGTMPDKVDVICLQNFDFRIAGTRVGALCGQGTYFALEAKFSDCYATTDQDNKFMFLAKVLVGKTCLGNPDLKRPPNLDDSDLKQGTYDTCVNNIHHPTVFCVFDRNQYYPEYIIEYET